jgi:hypothetical protein
MSHEDRNSFVRHHAFGCPELLNHANPVFKVEYVRTTAGADKKQTATVASFMREATLEGVKLFLIMLRGSYILHFEHWICMIKQFWTTKGVMPDKAVAILMRHGLITPDMENIEGLFAYDYEMSLESTSALASSSELKKAKDLELWDLIKEVDQIVDQETGTVYSVKKFKILMKLFEDYGWEPDNYISEMKQPTTVTPPADQVIPPANGAPAPGDAPAIELPPDAVPEQGLAGNEMGAMLGNAMKQ